MQLVCCAGTDPNGGECYGAGADGYIYVGPVGSGGELHCFANDLSCCYWNNCGSVQVHVDVDEPGSDAP